MEKEVLRIAGVKPHLLPFNHVIKAGNTLYLSSQLSCNLKTGEIIQGNIETQTRNALENIKYLLENSGSSIEKILKVVIYMRDVSEFDMMNSVYRKYFKKGEEPARVTVQAASPIDGIDIEIEITALAN